METIDYLLLGALILGMGAAARSCIRLCKQKKGCDGSCTHCDHSCGAK